MTVELSDQEMMRYNRQIVLRGFDFEGQEALKAASVLVVGLGGLGCAAAQYLAAAGVGRMTLLDFDTVSVSNLQRQTLHSDATLGQPKVRWPALTPTFSSLCLTRCWMMTRSPRKLPGTIWCSTAPITSPSVIS